MEEVLTDEGNHKPCGISTEVDRQGGGSFRYYEFEQYEDTLRKVKYNKDLGLSDDPH